jgi:predicted nucleic acid-binding protein
VVLLDTSVLIDSLTADRILLPHLGALIARGQPINLTTIVLYEWLRGPRTSKEIADQEDLFPARTAIAFGPDEAALSGKLYRSLRRARSREIDIAIAACAILQEAQLWTQNATDYADIPNLKLYRPAA